MKLQETIERLKVLARTAVTWLTFAALVLTVVAEEISKVWSGDTAQDVTTFLIRVGAWIGAAIAIVRRVTPVDKDERGILPE